ncbi:tail fiber protein, partial [Escherichia coli]
NDIAANMMTAGTLSYLLTNFQPLDPTLTAIAALVGAANKLPYFNGPDTAALTDLTAVGRDIIGKNTIADILTYLGLGGLGIGSALPVGVPVPWPTATPPTGWLKCNGATFSATTYPQLAVIFPSLALPDLRGEFIRGWDDSRGIDAGRTLLSDQLGTFVSVDINYADSGLVGAIGTTDPTGGIANVNGDTITTPLTKTAFQYAAVSGLAASTSLPGNTVATRPRNIAFNYIVRAA